VKRQQNRVPNVLTAAEAAAVAGVSLDTLRGWLDDKRFPCVHLDGEGKRVAIDADRLLEFLRNHCRTEGGKLVPS
jgi:excisionase family DNA binding protein